MKSASNQKIVQEAEAFLDEFMLQKAEQLARQAVQVEPKNPQAHAVLSKIYLYSQREEMALEEAKKAVGTRMGSFVAHRLAEHFLCLQQMAIRLERPNPRSFRLLDEAQRLAGEVPQNVGIRLSAVLIVKNEEAHLDRCLKSLEGLVDEIVVVDTGSTDGTLAIARKYGAKIGDFPWVDDFAAARNAALALATGNWALWIDADEELTADSHTAILNALIRPQFAGFNISIVNFTEDQGEGDQFVHAPVRLFRMLPGVTFTGRIHEQVAGSLLPHGLPLANLDKARLLHHGYRPSVMAERNKVDRTVTMLEKELAENPEDSFQWFNLANAYFIARRFDDAEVACRRSISTLKSSDNHAHSVYQILTEGLEQQARYDDALNVIAAAEARGLGWVQSEYTKASVLLSMGRFHDSFEAIQKCMSMEWPAGRAGDFSIVTYKRRGLYGQVQAALGHCAEAEKALREALAVADNPSLRWTLANVCEQTQRAKEAADLFETLLNDPQLGRKALLAYGRCSHTSADFQQAASAFAAAFRSEPEDTDAWIAWVQAAEELGDTQQVLNAYEEYAKHQEPTAALLINWGRALALGGALERAMDCFSEAIKRDPMDPNGYFNCGDLLYGLEQYGDAAQMYEGGLRLSPENVQGWFVLGNSLAQLGILEGAQVAYSQCLFLEPKHDQARHNLSVIGHAA